MEDKASTGLTSTAIADAWKLKISLQGDDTRSQLFGNWSLSSVKRLHSIHTG